MITTEQIKEVQTRVEALEGYLSIVEKRSLVQQEENKRMNQPFGMILKKQRYF